MPITFIYTRKYKEPGCIEMMAPYSGDVKNNPIDRWYTSIADQLVVAVRSEKFMDIFIYPGTEYNIQDTITSSNEIREVIEREVQDIGVEHIFDVRRKKVIIKYAPSSKDPIVDPEDWEYSPVLISSSGTSTLVYGAYSVKGKMCLIYAHKVAPIIIAYFQTLAPKIYGKSSKDAPLNQYGIRFTYELMSSRFAYPSISAESFEPDWLKIGPELPEISYSVTDECLKSLKELTLPERPSTGLAVIPPKTITSLYNDAVGGGDEEDDDDPFLGTGSVVGGIEKRFFGKATDVSLRELLDLGPDKISKISYFPVAIHMDIAPNILTGGEILGIKIKRMKLTNHKTIAIYISFTDGLLDHEKAKLLETLLDNTMEIIECFDLEAFDDTNK